MGTYGHIRLYTAIYAYIRLYMEYIRQNPGPAKSATFSFSLYLALGRFQEAAKHSHVGTNCQHVFEISKTLTLFDLFVSEYCVLCAVDAISCMCRPN